MISVHFLARFFVVCLFSFPLYAFLPAPEMDVKYVLAARHFAEHIYPYSIHQGVHQNANYLGEEWAAYPFIYNDARRNDPYAGAVFRKDKTLIISFRGSKTMFEWWKDVVAQQREASEIGFSGKVHTGFSHIFEHIQESFERKFIQAYQDAGGSCDCIFTGHSLGGALASICAGYTALPIKQNLFPEGRQENQIKVINFSSPYIGNLYFTRQIEELLYPHNLLCYANQADLVTYMPPSLMASYCGIGVGISLDTAEHLFGVVTDYAQYFDPRRWNLENATDILAVVPAVSTALMAWFTPSNWVDVTAVGTAAGTTALTMHRITEESLVRRKFLHLQNVASSVENYEEFSDLMRTNPT